MKIQVSVSAMGVGKQDFPCRNGKGPVRTSWHISKTKLEAYTENFKSTLAPGQRNELTE